MSGAAGAGAGQGKGRTLWWLAALAVGMFGFGFAMVPLYGLLYALVRGWGSGERYPRPTGEALANIALGYVITGVKQS